MTTIEAPDAATPGPRRRAGVLGRLLGDPGTMLFGLVLVAFLGFAIAAPLVAGDPLQIAPAKRLTPPAADAIWGRDHLGRDVFARAIYGTQVSMLVGFAVAAVATLVGVSIGLYAGLAKFGAGIVMRLIDAMMAIPAILLAIALAALMDAGLTTVIIAIGVPEVPRMVRLVRAVVLGVREQPYVMAATSIGTSGMPLVLRHILPNTLGPVLVQATYACASAIIASAVLSFLGVGISPEIPSWGGMMADARTHFRDHPELMAYPGVLLSLLVLAINVLGDRLSDSLDPRKQRKGGL